jgi:hypothetical protein
VIAALSLPLPRSLGLSHFLVIFYYLDCCSYFLDRQASAYTDDLMPLLYPLHYCTANRANNVFLFPDFCEIAVADADNILSRAL